MSASDEIRRDLTKALLIHMQEDLNRRLNLMTGILSDADIALLLMEVSTSLLLGAQVFTISRTNDGIDVDGILDMMDTSIQLRLKRNRERLKRTAEAIRRGEDVTEAV